MDSMHREATQAGGQQLKACLHQIFQNNLQSDWEKKHYLHEEISPAPHFLSPIQEDSVQWGFDSQGCQMDLEGKPWLLSDRHLLPVSHA